MTSPNPRRAAQPVPRRFPERIPTNVLSERLARLRRHGIVVQVAPPDGSKHLAHRVTPFARVRREREVRRVGSSIVARPS